MSAVVVETPPSERSSSPSSESLTPPPSASSIASTSLPITWLDHLPATLLHRVMDHLPAASVLQLTHLPISPLQSTLITHVRARPLLPLSHSSQHAWYPFLAQHATSLHIPDYIHNSRSLFHALFENPRLTQLSITTHPTLVDLACWGSVTKLELFITPDVRAAPLFDMLHFLSLTHLSLSGATDALISRQPPDTESVWSIIAEACPSLKHLRLLHVSHKVISLLWLDIALFRLDSLTIDVDLWLPMIDEQTLDFLHTIPDVRFTASPATPPILAHLFPVMRSGLRRIPLSQHTLDTLPAFSRLTTLRLHLAADLVLDSLLLLPNLNHLELFYSNPLRDPPMLPDLNLLPPLSYLSLRGLPLPTPAALFPRHHALKTLVFTLLEPIHALPTLFAVLLHIISHNPSPNITESLVEDTAPFPVSSTSSFHVGIHEYVDLQNCLTPIDVQWQYWKPKLQSLLTRVQRVRPGVSMGSLEWLVDNLQDLDLGKMWKMEEDGPRLVERETEFMHGVMIDSGYTGKMYDFEGDDAEEDESVGNGVPDGDMDGEDDEGDEDDEEDDEEEEEEEDEEGEDYDEGRGVPADLNQGWTDEPDSAVIETKPRLDFERLPVAPERVYVARRSIRSGFVDAKCGDDDDDDDDGDEEEEEEEEGEDGDETAAEDEEEEEADDGDGANSKGDGESGSLAKSRSEVSKSKSEGDLVIGGVEEERKSIATQT